MEQETYLERIKKLKSAQKITNEKLSEMTGIPLGTLSKILAGISDSPKLSNIVAISRALGCSMDYLMTGKPENTHNYTLEPVEITLIENYRMLDVYGKSMTSAVIDMERARVARQAAEEALRLHDMARRTTRGTRGRHAVEEPDGVAARVTAAVTLEQSADITPVARGPAAHVAPGVLPVISAAVPAMPTKGITAPDTTMPAGLRRRRISLYNMPVSAGTGVFLDDGSRTEILIPDGPRTVEADYALRISGDSMEPRYRSGDVLLVQNCESVEEGELGIFVLDGLGYFKKYGGDCLISLNPAYAPIMLKDFSEMSCCGRVVGKLKKK